MVLFFKSLRFKQQVLFLRVRWSKILTLSRTLSADRPRFDGLTWEALCRVSMTLAFARRLTNLQMIGFGAPFCCLEGTRWAMSMSDRNTSAPISWNKGACFSCGFTAFLWQANYFYIKLVAIFLNLVSGVASTCDFSTKLIKTTA